MIGYQTVVSLDMNWGKQNQRKIFQIGDKKTRIRVETFGRRLNE